MNSHLKTLAVGVAALSAAALAFAAPASAQQTSRHRAAAAHHQLQYNEYGSVSGPEYGERAPLPFSARTVVGTDPDSNVRLELQRDPPNTR